MRKTLLTLGIAAAITLGAGATVAAAAADDGPSTGSMHAITPDMGSAMGSNGMSSMMGSNAMSSMMDATGTDSMMGTMPAGDMDAMHTQMRDAMPAELRDACDKAHAAMTTATSDAPDASTTPSTARDHDAHHNDN